MKLQKKKVGRGEAEEKIKMGRCISLGISQYLWIREIMADNVMGNQSGASGHVREQPSRCPATQPCTPHTSGCKVPLGTHYLTVLQPFLSDLTHNPLIYQFME